MCDAKITKTARNAAEKIDGEKMHHTIEKACNLDISHLLFWLYSIQFFRQEPDEIIVGDSENEKVPPITRSSRKRFDFNFKFNLLPPPTPPQVHRRLTVSVFAF
jgi:hypothetical protein